LDSPPKDASLFERYSRQILFAGVGEAGQQRLASSRAVIVGCGAIGAATALTSRSRRRRPSPHPRPRLRRAFQPSTPIALRRIRRARLAPQSRCRTAKASLRKLFNFHRRDRCRSHFAKCDELLSGFDVILDGTDNFETRFLINDFAVKNNRPWIYAAAVGSYGVTMTIRPGLTACLACLLEGERAASGVEETCDTVGVLGPVVQLISSLESAEALKFLAGKEDALHGRLISSDVWSGRFQSVEISRNADCRACARRDFSYLEGDAQPHVTMCGRDSVQIHERFRSLDLAASARALLLPPNPSVTMNSFSASAFRRMK